MIDRRRHERLPLGCRVLLTRIDQESRPIQDREKVACLGKDVSQSGICFSHSHPLKDHRFLLSFHDATVGHGVVEAEVVWTRSVGAGYHETGCCFVRKLIAPPGLAGAAPGNRSEAGLYQAN